MGVNSCFLRAYCVFLTEVTQLFRLKNRDISCVTLFTVMPFEILHSADDDPGPFYLSAQTVYPPWQRQTARLSFIDCNLRCGFFPSWKGLSEPYFAKSPMWRDKLLPNGIITARLEYLILVAVILLLGIRNCLNLDFTFYSSSFSVFFFKCIKCLCMYLHI